MHPKNTQISVDHRNLGTPKMFKNHPKSSIVTLKKHPKTLRNLFSFRRIKIDLAFGTRKNGEKHRSYIKAPRKTLQIRLFLDTAK
jgi:hypothetical protein